MTKKFYIVDDHAADDDSKLLWDKWLYTGLQYLPSKPPGWKKCPSLPEGDWTMTNEVDSQPKSRGRAPTNFSVSNIIRYGLV